MFVAVSSQDNKQVVAFVDVDARPSKQQPQDPPRPYLSDLCILRDWRRKGIATTLVQKCEFLVREKMQKDELYIRVEQTNQAAITMYNNLQYNRQAHSFFGVKDTTMLLHKRLTSTRMDSAEDDACVGDATENEILIQKKTQVYQSTALYRQFRNLQYCVVSDETSTNTWLVRYGT